MQVRQDFFQTSDGARLYYEEAGEGRPLVLVHGYKCSSRFFRGLMERLSSKYRVLALDLRGHGNSSKIMHDHSIDRYADDLHEFLAFKSALKAFIVGWSMGGSVVLRCHLKYGTQYLSAMALVDCTLSPYSAYPWNKHALNNTNVELTQKIAVQCDMDHSSYCEGFADKIWNMKCSPEEKEWVKQELLKTPSYISMAIYSDFIHTDGAAMLRQVCVPVLFYGSDSVVSPNGAACAVQYYPEFLPAHIIRESCAIEGGTHIPFITNTEEFDKALGNFMKKY